MAAVKVADEIPQSWLDQARREAGYDVPARLSEPPVSGSPVDPADVAKVVDQVKERLFPFHM
jgi:hypothetical protein